MDLQEIKNELKGMYPKMHGFIQHTLVAEMCLKWHEKQVKNCAIPIVVGQSKQLPFEFIKWYSGMEEQKILNAYKRWQKEEW